MRRRENGIVLVMVIILAVIFTIIGFSVLTLAEQEIIQTRIDTDKAKAFYMAEAGLAKLQETLQIPINGKSGKTGNLNFEGTLEQGRFRVDIDTNSNPCYAVSTGISGPIQKKVRVQAAFLAAPFEDAVYAMNSSGGSWSFQLRGTGNPKSSGGRETGGKDEINGNISIDGDALFYEESQVNHAPSPNKWELDGDVSATGKISTFGSASIAGSRTPDAEEPEPVDMEAMNYAVNNTNNVSQTFQDAHVTSGYLPSGNALRDVFVKNPSDRAAECGTTTDNDYFFEPSSGFALGTEKTGATPIHAGNNKVYYVDGDVWVHSKSTYGFKMDGKVTIVATGNIHICDNIEYANKDSALGLIALGKYDSSGNLISGGDIFFGDPRYGTMYVLSGMMFAAKDFLFNADAVTRATAEPTSGFTVNGSFAALGQVKVERDWYNKSVTSGGHTTTEARPAKYNPATGTWVDSQTGAALTTTEVGSMRHYQMIVNYDDRVRSPETQPPMLPRGGANIFSGFSNWEEL
jgi:hypothetical protein